MNNALLMGPPEKEKLAALVKLAHANPVDMGRLVPSLKTKNGKAAHRLNMTAQTVWLPLTYLVTFSIETNVPCGSQRHMSMSTSRIGYIPNPVAAWMVAESLGFVGSIDACMRYVEELEGHGKALNLVQPIEQPRPKNDDC